MPGAPSVGMAGLETTSLTSSESPGSASGSMSTAPTVELDLPPAIPGSQKTPGTVEAAPLAPPNAEFAAAASSPLAASPTEPAGSAPAASQFLDLDSPPAGALPESPAPTATPIPFLEIGEPGAPESPSGAADAGPFVTETMAELYLRQGHREEALRVYRALLDQRPGDPALAAKVASLQTIATGPAPADPPRGEVDSQQWQPTIREVLGAIAQRRPGSRPAPKPLRLNGAVAAPPRTQPAPSAEPSVAPAATILSTVSASPVQPGASSVAAPPTTSASSDAISRLFGNAQISSADEGAAQSLALAFADTNGAPGVVAEVGGTPARRASNELSLDTVFGGGEGGAAGGGGASPAAAPSSFSFDQFFSTRASTQQSSGTVPPGSAGTASPEEVAHFTKWLEGLKQR